MSDAQAETGVIALTAQERATLHAGVCRRHSDTAPGVYICGPCEQAGDAAVELILAARVAEALAIVKRACDIECKSPGKHTGCSAHEPYRALRDAVFPPVLSDLPEPRGNHCPGCGWSSGGHDPRCPTPPGNSSGGDA